MSQFTFIDLFAGIGGFRVALSNVGGDCLGFSEIDNDAINTYCTNFSEEPERNFGDITKIKSLPPHDLLTAGVPCQSWSIAGKNLGFDDDRGQLWNDTLYLLNQARPKAFIFENVKGLVDPRNQGALDYIMRRIREAGYFAGCFVLNSFDYGVAQHRIRVYIVGFREEKYYKKFALARPVGKKIRLADILTDIDLGQIEVEDKLVERDLFGNVVEAKRGMSLSNTDGLNDYFLFNDIRNGHTTIHSWDILETSEKQKRICLLLLQNRRKSKYGNLDGNPLSLKHFQELDGTISQSDLNELVALNILKEEQYIFTINSDFQAEITEEEEFILSLSDEGQLVPDLLGSKRELKVRRIAIAQVMDSLLQKGIIHCTELRYDFKYGKISTGLFGVNRVFLPTSNIFPTLVASDSNDFVATVSIEAKNQEDYKRQFVEEVYKKGSYRKISKSEACLIQGFPESFILPENRSRWMKLIGNSVSVPVVEMLGKAICATGVFEAGATYSPVDSTSTKQVASP